MSRIKIVIELASMALASMIVTGLALGPEAVTRKLDNALLASWRALGDHLVSRELDAIAGELDRERQNFEHIGSLRDALVAHLQSLAVRRDCVRAQMDEEGQPHGAESECELSHVDAAIARLRSALARAESALEAARHNLRQHETELVTLRALAETSRIDRVLNLSGGDPSPWNERFERIDESLRTTTSHDLERGTRPKLTGLP